MPFKTIPREETLDIPSTVIDREYTNERMYEMIRNQYTCHYESFGDTWRKRKCKFLGHILFFHRDDPLFQVTFSYNIFFARTSPLLRPGRPRADWLIESLKDACLNLFGPDRHFNFSDRQLLSDIQQAAINRTRPFRKDHKNDGDLCVPRPLASRGNALGSTRGKALRAVHTNIT